MPMPLDAPVAHYVVVVTNDNYDQTVLFFCEEKAAREYAAKAAIGTYSAEVVVAKII